ncbi:DUF4062 domain-containing protein [Staphylococcus aureus]|uniref:DUF4062 domain-containing protein n=1 Tax=Staphylococcus aureus TaxID=1280 RepID=UPI002240FF31|nr:DUF4062 domain-containing protein [Staphylococcus aureus]
MSNTKIKYQIFISSTYLDLIEERQAVVEAVLNSNNIPAGMELLTQVVKPMGNNNTMDQ